MDGLTFEEVNYFYDLKLILAWLVFREETIARVERIYLLDQEEQQAKLSVIDENHIANGLWKTGKEIPLCIENLKRKVVLSHLYTEVDMSLKLKTPYLSKSQAASTSRSEGSNKPGEASKFLVKVPTKIILSIPSKLMTTAEAEQEIRRKGKQASVDPESKNGKVELVEGFIKDARKPSKKKSGNCLLLRYK
ncbi:hypothetical protein PanWU01x14_019470 [Parasponia andersonii]|uniref:Uncharacterized protein n=1 Tax=Parasponia andersonii TaxID=3476 RepID=A0A2P5DYE1_PARAD|nr:hypothetical protein PanWU01x14_019470 [Parasponia andersonii]